MKRFFVLLLFLSVVSVGAIGQTDGEVTEEQIRQAEQGQLNLMTRPFWNLEFGTFGSMMVDVKAIRADGEQRATIRVSTLFPGDSQLTLTRIDFLSPQALAGDVYIIRTDEDDRRTSDVWFWNPGLVSALKIDGKFELFGDAGVLETIGLRIVTSSKYLVTDRHFSDVVPDVPAPEYMVRVPTGGVFVERVIKEAPLAEIYVEPIEARRETEPFPMIKTFAFLSGDLYKIEFMDADGDLIHTHHYDWREFEIMVLNGFEFKFVREYTIENHLIAGNFTTLTIKSIESNQLTLDDFDPELLGQ